MFVSFKIMRIISGFKFVANQTDHVIWHTFSQLRLLKIMPDFITDSLKLFIYKCLLFIFLLKLVYLLILIVILDFQGFNFLDQFFDTIVIN